MTSLRHLAICTLLLSALQPFSSSALSATAPLSLSGPEVIKLDWGTRSLCVGDLNGDGLPDIAVANNDRSTIELLYQLKPGETPPRIATPLSANRWEPEVENARFRKSSITTGVVMFDLAIGDLNGDGLPDLAYTGSPQNLTLRLQQPDGAWLEKKIPEAPVPNQLAGSLRIADLDGDGRADIAMLGAKELAVFYQNADGTLAAPERYTLPDDNCYGLEVVDIDGDGLPDLLYLCNAPRQTVRVRLQTPNRQFGPELSYEIKNSRCTLQILHNTNGKRASSPSTGERAFQPADGSAASEKTPPLSFAFAQDATGQLEEFALRSADIVQSKGSFQLPTLHPRIFSPRPAAKTPFAYALGNFTKSKKSAPTSPSPSSTTAPDLVVADPDAAQVYLYARQPDGGFTIAQKSPVFSDARSIASGDWYNENRDALFVASSKEQAVGVSRYIDGRFEYPKPLPVTGRPLAIAYGNFDGHNRNLLAVLLENKGARTIELWANKNNTPERIKTIEITNLKTDPRSIRLIDANQDGLLDIAIFTPLDSMRLYVQTPTPSGELNFTEASADSSFRRGLVDNLESSALTLGDINGDGKPELITASTGYARALRLTNDGLQVIDQFNARNPNAEITAALVIPPAATTTGERAFQPADGSAAPSKGSYQFPTPPPGTAASQSKIENPKSKISTTKAAALVVLYDRKAEQFQFLRPDAAGLYQIVDTAPAGKIDLIGAEVLPGSREAFIFGRDRFWWLPLAQPDLTAVTLSTHTTDLPGISYADVIAGDLDNDGQPELICVDPVKNLLEILHRAPDGIRWDSLMHFKVFEVDQHYQGRRGTPLEPRETVIANLTASPTGKKSILLLVHDRILIYPQE